jgi:hypothetical protein
LAYYASNTNAVSSAANTGITAGALTLGTANSVLGSLTLEGSTSGAVLIQPQAAAGTYNFNLPTSAGSSGQALLSGGGSSAMTFGALALSNLATETANTVVGNGTGSTAVPTALSIPSCSASQNALIWTSGTGFGCNTISGSGTVSSGTAGEFAYYATSTNVVSTTPDASISAGAVTLGAANSVLGSLTLDGSSSGAVTIQPQAAAGTYNFLLPTG